MTTVKKEKFEPKDVNELLWHIQINLKAPKSQYNSFGKYHYRNCEDIQEAVKPLLPQGASLKVTDDLVMIGDRFYVKATASLKYKGEVECNTSYAREAAVKKGMDDSQVTGATSSYARKYALNGLLLIDDNKDADSDNKDKTNEKDAFSMAYDPEQNEQAYQQALKKISGISSNEALDAYWKDNKNKLNKLPTDKYEDIVAACANQRTDINSKLNGVHNG